jgi:hypothetical protein
MVPGRERERERRTRKHPHYSVVFAHHILGPFFSGWASVSDSADAGKTNNDCDRHLVCMANAMGVPLITSETKPKGALRVAARRAGARVMTPREFWEARDDEEDLIERLFGRWTTNKQDLWRRARPSFKNATLAATILGWMDGYLRHVLIGEEAEGS